jgi:hypothetical protein
MTPTAAAAVPRRKKALNPHPAIAFLLDPNHGDFMPPAYQAAKMTSVADSLPLSPYPALRLVARIAAADHGPIKNVNAWGRSEHR